MHFFNPEKVNNRFQGPVYDSKPREPGFFTRAFPSLSYYLRVYAKTTMWTVIKAKRGTFDDKAWLYSCNWFLDDVESTGIHVHADGLQYIDQLKGRPCVICANHMSTLETYMLPAMILPRFPVTFVVKKALVEMPLFGDVMKSRSPVVLGRSNPKEDLMAVLHEGSDRLKKGMSVVVFPQGTRCEHFDDAKFNSLAVKLAARAGVPLVPLALKTDAWSVGHRIKDCGRIYPNRDVLFRFFPPITVNGPGHAEHNAIRETLSETLSFWEKRQDILDRHALPFTPPNFRLPAAIDPAALAESGQETAEPGQKPDESSGTSDGSRL